MPRITKVYTRTGDEGDTALASGRRLPKDSPRIEAYGTVDELNSVLGAAVAAGIDDRLAATLGPIQNELFHLGSDLCLDEEDKKRLDVPGIEKRHVENLERVIDALSEELGPLENFILPGGNPAASQLHVARTVCRRAERRVVSLAREEPIGDFVLRYLNRLSDLLFMMARAENRRRGLRDVVWDSRA